MNNKKKWQYRKLKEIVIEIKSGFACGKNNIVTNGVPHLRPFNISLNGKLNFSNLVLIPKNLVKKTGYGLKKGDLLFNNTNSKELVGKIGLVENDMDFSFSNHMTKISINEKIADPAWVLFYFMFLWSKDYFFSNSVKWIGQAGFGLDKLKEIEIPVPDIKEQKIIVKKLLNYNNDLIRLNSIQGDSGYNLKEMLNSIYSKIQTKTTPIKFGDIAPLIRRKVIIDRNTDYPELGIRSFGKGTFHKPVLNGKDVGTKKIYQILEDDLIFSNVFAWEGAIAVAKKEDNGRFGSHRYITCEVKQDVARPKYLLFYFLTDEGMRKIREASPGGAGRNRTLGLKTLSEIIVPIPSLSEQIRFEKMLNFISRINGLENANSNLSKEFIQSVLISTFN